MWKEMVEKERRTAMVHVDTGAAIATWAQRLRQPACLLLSCAALAALLGALRLSVKVQGFRRGPGSAAVRSGCF